MQHTLIAEIYIRNEGQIMKHIYLMHLEKYGIRRLSTGILELKLLHL
jgi:hypothetical protein